MCWIVSNWIEKIDLFRKIKSNRNTFFWIGMLLSLPKTAQNTVAVPRWAQRPRGGADVQASWSREAGMHRCIQRAAVIAATCVHCQTASLKHHTSQNFSYHIIYVLRQPQWSQPRAYTVKLLRWNITHHKTSVTTSSMYSDSRSDRSHVRTLSNCSATSQLQLPHHQLWQVTVIP